MPYKYKARAGRHVSGQISYDPYLDANNWELDAINLKDRGLSEEALQKALYHSQNKPRVLTKIGKLRERPVEKQLFPNIESINQPLK